MEIPDFEKLNMRSMMEGWDGNLYVDEAALDIAVHMEKYKGTEKRDKLHILAVGVGAYYEKGSGYEEADIYRILDLTGICFSNELNNHGANSKKRNKDGRLTGYWKILGAHSLGLILSVLDRLKSGAGLEPGYVWVCTQTYKYMTIADEYECFRIKPVIIHDEHGEDEHAGEEDKDIMYESRMPKIELSQDEIKLIPEARYKKQRVGKIMRKILGNEIAFDSDTIERVAGGEVLEITRHQFIDTVPFWDMTMTEQQLKKYICGITELYSRNPRIV